MQIDRQTFEGVQTPVYVLEEELLRRNLQLIAGVAADAGVEIILAYKAYALWKTFPIFREYIHATTASSLYEARLAAEEFGEKAHTYSPAYTDKDFDEIVRCSSHLTFNSLSQYERFHERIAGKCSIGLRINPGYSEVETLLYNPCAPGTRFGVRADKLPQHLPNDIEGFHCHCHCESGSDVFERTLAHIEEQFAPWFSQLKWINFGGGHLMTRKDYDVPLLINILKGFKERYPNLKVILEPGSAFGWQTGPLVAEVVDIVEDQGIRTAILNVSFTCHMPDCLEMPYYPEVRGAVHVPPSSDNASPRSSFLVNSVDFCHDSANQASLMALAVPKVPPSSYIYRLGGNSCLSGDYMGNWQFDHELRVGERIIFEDMLHYTTVKTNMFNGVPHPAIAFLHADGELEMLREYGYDDYKNRMD